MKLIKQILAMLAVGLSMTIARAQTIDCSAFSLLGFGPDPMTPGNSEIHIYLGGAMTDFISYPYISFVTDCNGDTIATGNMYFFGQGGQTVLSYPVSGDITSSCLPLSVQFIYGNTNFETDTCLFSINSLPAALTCADFIPIDIQADLTNTLVNISMLGTGNTYISNPRISFVTDCVGDTIATGFINFSGQLGLSTQGYPITSLVNTVCYPVTVEFIYGNTDFETDTCLLTLNSTASAVDPLQLGGDISMYPIPSSDRITISTGHKLYDKKYLLYDAKGTVMMTGKIFSDNTILEIGHLADGLYFLKIEDDSGTIIKVVKQ